MFAFFDFCIWHAVVAYIGVSTEQFTKFNEWSKAISYKIDQIVSDFPLALVQNGGLNQVTLTEKPNK